MNTATHYQRVSPRRPCAICGKTSWCLYDPAAGTALCTRVESSEPDVRFHGYLHRVEPTPEEAIPSAEIARRPPDPLSDEEALARDRLYKFIAGHQFCQLTAADRENLHVRGLDDEAIARHGYFAYPDRSRSGQVMRDLEQFAKNKSLTVALWRLPGIEALDRKGGGFYQVLVWANRQRGYGALAIPICDTQGRMIAISLRHRDGERETNDPRYTWLSSRYARSGAPVHLARPHTLSNAQRLIITEGALKANIAAERLGCPVVAVPGISIWRGVLSSLEALEAAGAITKKARIVLAYDQEPENDDVAKEQHKLHQHLTEAGYTVSLLTWNPSEGKGIDDALRNGADVTEAAGTQDNQQNASTNSPPADDTWDDPVPLPDGMPTVDPFSLDLLPDALHDWVQDIAERMQVPTDFPAIAAVVAAAALVGRQVAIFPKKQDDWSVVPNLWGAIVGPPSAMKSPSLAEAMKPLDRLAVEARETYEKAMAGYEVEAMLAEARKTARAEKIKKAAKANNEGEMERLAREIVEEPERPIMRRYKTNDATVEKLGELLLQNPNGLLQFRDELVGWLRTMDKQGHEGDRAFYLESWIGLNSHDVDRIGRGSLHIPAVCLSILGGIQPGPLASYVYDATGENSAGNDGLLQRFQLFVWPDMPKTWRNVDRWPNAEAKNRAYAVYKRLAALDLATIGAAVPEGDANLLPALRFSDEAQVVFNEWRDRLEQRLRTEEMSSPLQAHLAKYRSLMPSLALLFHLFHLMDNEDNGPAQDGVSVTAAVRATAWCEYLESHAKRLYVHAENPGLERARALLAHIKAGDVEDETPVRQLYRHHWSHLATPEEMDDAIKTLDAFGWVRIERPEGRQGRPSAKVHLHPLLTRRRTSEAA